MVKVLVKEDRMLKTKLGTPHIRGLWAPFGVGSRSSKLRGGVLRGTVKKPKG